MIKVWSFIGDWVLVLVILFRQPLVPVLRVGIQVFLGDAVERADLLH